VLRVPVLSTALPACGIFAARFTQWGEVEVQVRHGEVQLPEDLA
jgi:adenine deaminase